jgi:subfamily B ATP-binding cassette protein MsbA
MMFRGSSRRSRPEGDPAPVMPRLDETLRLLGYLRPYRARMIVAVIALVSGAALGLIFPLIIQNLINTVLQSADLSQLNRITLLLIATFLIRSVMYYFEVYSLSYVGERIVVDLRSQTYSRLHRLSLRFFTERRTGELLSRLTSDVTLVRSALTNNVAAVLSQALTFAGSLGLMLYLNWRLTLFILALVPVVIISAVVFGARLRKLSTTVQDRLADSSALAEEALGNVRVVKSFAREPYEVQRYLDAITVMFQTTLKMIIVRAAFGPLITFLAFSSLAAILWFGGREVLASRLSAGALIAFLVYGINIASSVGGFTSLYTQLQEAAGATRRIFDLLDETPDIADRPGAIPLPALEGRITFDNVSFTYAVGTEHVLCEINLEIAPGEILALVGPSGAGKSTLFNLIPRFYDPSQGSVRIDGHDLRTVTLETLRSQIGLVPQETQLFSGSVRENLRYGRLDASDAELEAAAQAANAEEFIHRLPDGYDTLVGERGVKLSGGQRQRVAIGRALLRNPRILLLDEATSSLDSESEGLVQEALERLMQNRTTIIIAHRLSTIHKAHRIAVLDQGNLVELGNHAELMEKDGLYARLYRLQFRGDSHL